MGTSLLNTALPMEHYTVVEIAQQQYLAHWDGTQWELDTTCQHINALLRDGFLDLPAIRAWLSTQHTRH
jgi:hypothetical protein